MLVGLLLILVSCGDGDTDSGSKRTATTKPAAAAQDATKAVSGATSLLFVQQAAQGSFVPAAGQEGLFTLTLNGLDPEVLYFSDRPARDAGTISPEMLLEALGYAKGDAPPNAAIQVSDAPADGNVRAVELLNPAYDAGARSMTYQARPLDQWTKPGIGQVQSDLDNSIPQQFGRVSLFIDDVSHTCQVDVLNFATETLESAGSDKWSTDSWDTRPQGGIPGAQPGRQFDQVYSSSSPPFRGCGNSSTWKYPDGTTIEISVTDPYGKDPNTFSCTSSDPSKYNCTGPSGETKGDNINVQYNIGPA
jgi:hypothetical protein